MIKKLIPKSLRNKLDRKLKKKFAYTEVTKPYQINIENGLRRLDGQIAVVTGGSGVIGRAIACRLAAEGAKVYVCGTSIAKAQVTVDDVIALGGQAVPFVIDLSSEEDIKARFREINEAEGKIDLLINSAGGSSREKNARIDQLSINVIDTILTINLRGTMLCCREAAKYMVDKKAGNIVCITSVIGERGKAKFSEYAAAKAGIIAFVKSIAMELGPLGIRVNCVSPGIVPRGEVNGEQVERLTKTNYLADYGKPEDIANMTMFLTTEEASFITGQNFMVDGGRSLGLKGD
ncbi:SDR family NAD(P)-dependent oxidoreductase [Sphingobacterium corticis]|uniref:SDR family NAD(P)-dependent oxidoreductase n=1 Tax=Sphingobacterium corticis TaxID=1812823 RepID=A0ABW5NJK2_9SPHI